VLIEAETYRLGPPPPRPAAGIFVVDNDQLTDVNKD